MQIKRFEAAEMTEALRMVRRAFGGDAVILSAKEVRPGGFFRALRKKSVEITAATDYPAARGNHRNDFPGILSAHLDTDIKTDRVSLSKTPKAIKPFVKLPRSFLHQPPASASIDGPMHRNDTTGDPQIGPNEGYSASPTTMGCGTKEASPDQWEQYAAGTNQVAKPFYRDGGRPQTIAFVGPSGTGKSTAMAKLAWHCRRNENIQTGLISLDRFRLNANSMLARVACIMNLSFTVVRDTEQLQLALANLAGVDVVLVDTPGINRMDVSMRDEVGALLRLAQPDETHLVSNATVRKDVFAAAVDTFSPLGVNRLLFTHMDECIERTSVSSLLNNISLPASFYTDGVEVFDGLHELSVDRLPGQSLRAEEYRGQVTPFSRKRTPRTTEPAAGRNQGKSTQYVANRNSELFHHPNCKSVKRINAENIAAFSSIDQAIDEGFKPCRACCDLNMPGKSVTGTFAYQRANAI